MGQPTGLASNFVVLEGRFKADVVLVTPGRRMAHNEGEDIARMNEPVTFAIVPRNTWHTARVHNRAATMFITPGEGIENREEPPRKG